MENKDLAFELTPLCLEIFAARASSNLLCEARRERLNNGTVNTFGIMKRDYWSASDSFDTL